MLFSLWEKKHHSFSKLDIDIIRFSRVFSFYMKNQEAET